MKRRRIGARTGLSTAPAPSGGGGGGGGGGFLAPDILAMDFVTMTASGPVTFTGSPNGQTMTNPWGFGITIVGGAAHYQYNGVNDGTGHAASASDDHSLQFRTGARALGSSVWTRGRITIAANSGDARETRKLIRITNDSGQRSDTILVRVGTQLLWTCQAYNAAGSLIQNRDGLDTGVVIPNATLTTIEQELVLSSGVDVADGAYHLYINGALTPDFTQTGLVMQFDSNAPLVNFGAQWSMWLGEALFTDVRDWKDLAISSTRIGAA